jgi:gamma-glutamyl hercynylcysteine S-oxide synthase
MGSPIAAPQDVSAATALQGLREARDRTLALVAAISDEDLERVHSSLMSPLVWDLGHIAAFEDLWLVHRYGGQPLLRDELADVYDAFETPRAGRGDLPFLRPDEARGYLAEVRERTQQVIDERGVGDGVIHEMVIRHEHQHNETMLQTMQLAHLDGPPVLAPGRPLARAAAAGKHTGLELIEIPAGPCSIGAAPGRFAYDNERPRHRTDVRGYLIGRTPITNASYLTFVEGGGYERREWWSDEGWAWKEQYDITRPGAWTADHAAEWHLGSLQPLDLHRPVVHISWFEADAFARAIDARLPTEPEWEKAATWDQGHGGSTLALAGDVWEWTSTEFGGYPGFEAYPYREYSEVFFNDGYKVLRGGSWATSDRVKSATFRNWDYRERRQIFSGLRIVRDA